MKRLEAVGARFSAPTMMPLTRAVPQRRAHGAAGLTLSPGIGFPGFDSLTSGGGYPGDVDVAAGSGQVAEVANSGLSVWTRSGGLLERVLLGQVLGAPSQDLGDPQIVYDALSARWFLSAMSAPTDQTYFAVSDSSDATAGWSVYTIDFGSSYCPDQPRLGVSAEVVAVTVALFEGSACRTDASATEFGGYVSVVNKAEMLAGADHPSTQSFGPDPSYDNYQPAVELEPSVDELFVSAETPTSNVIHVVHYVGAPPTATFTTTDTLLVSPLSTPPNAAQPGSSAAIDTGDNRISSAVLLGSVLYVSANDACQDSSGSLSACGRLMEINLTPSKLLGEVDVGINGGDAYYIAAAPDPSGDLIAVFDYSDPNNYPSIAAIAAQGPLIGEDSNNLTDYIPLASGTAPTESGRYGDYSGAAIDWTQPTDVWVGSEVSDDLGLNNSQWASHIDMLSFSAAGLVPETSHQVWSPGASYKGPTRQGWTLRLDTGGGGGRIETLHLTGIALTCQRHYVNRFGATLTPTPGTPFTQTGAFRTTQALDPDPFARWTRLVIAGQLNNNRITGTIQATEGSRHHGTCRSGTVRFGAS